MFTGPLISCHNNEEIEIQKGSTTKYGLYHIVKKRLLTIHTSETSEHDDSYTQYSLSIEDSTLWLVNDPRHAEYVRLNSTHYYNADYETPINNFKPKELKVVSVEFNVKEIEVSIPSYTELIEKIYANEAIHRDYLIKQYHQAKDKCKFSYMLYDLMRYFGFKRK